MRLWSLNPALLDIKGLIAVWREGLLAKHVLLGNTRGYTHHPQLIRFKNVANPLLAINSYLFFIYKEAEKRGYAFDSTKIDSKNILVQYIAVTEGQVYFEFEHLCSKLAVRDPEHYQSLCKQKQIDTITAQLVHPLFYSVPGSVEVWEKRKA